MNARLYNKGFLIILLLCFILFYQGCILAVEPLSGYTQLELPTNIIFSEGLYTYTYPLQDLGLEITYTWEGEVFSGFLLVCSDEEKLRQGLNGLAALINRPALNAAYKLNEQGQLTITPAYEGREVDLDRLYATLVSRSSYLESYPLFIKEVKPLIAETELQDKQPDTLWASYSTILANIPDRTENVRVASSFLDGLMLAPGQEISFNDQVGPREKERGFREAKVIVGGRFEPGLGGGVCQVSSTLYNVVLLAGLEIKERYNHSVRIAYVPVGRDATVLFGSKDFKFRNNTPSYLLLRTNLVGLKLEMSIYGNGPRPYTKVQIMSKVLQTLPTYNKTYLNAALAPSERKLVEKGQNGYISETYRQLTQGQEIINQLLSKDYYLPQPNVYAVGGKIN